MNLLAPIVAFGFLAGVVIVFGGFGYVVGMVSHWVGIF